MNNTLLKILLLVVLTALQLYTIRDIYKQLTLQQQRLDSTIEAFNYYVDRQEIIEATVVRHDEEISVLKEVKK